MNIGDLNRRADEIKQNEIKEQRAVAMLPLIQAPELIKVRTISPKIAEQLPWIGVNDPRLMAQEIIGIMPREDTIIVRHKDSGHLSRVAGLTYIDTRTKQLELEGVLLTSQAIAQANAEKSALPQLFQV